MWNIAQVNIARMNAPSIDDPIMSEFVAQLDNINKLAESSTGFVWRLKEEGGNATTIKFSDDARIIVNMSVWNSIDELSHFTYKTLHRDVLAQRTKWFEKMSNHFQALWYVPRHSFPSIEDAKFRLTFLEKNGPTPMAFNFAKRFSSDAYVEMLNGNSTSLKL
jgi:hypothetical protein